ncbi:MAG: tetratricopeptide repeat protein, partial [Vampirovibrionia bacterium]
NIQETREAQHINYYVNLGRKTYESYIVHNKECDLDLAISTFEKVLEIDPQNGEAYYKLASLLWEKGYIDIDTAITQCSKAIDLDPKNIDARLYLGYFFKAAGNIEEAISQFKEAVKLSFFKSGKSRIALGVSIIQKARKSNQKLKDVVSGLAHFILGVLLLASDKKSVNLILHSTAEELKVFRFKTLGYVLETLGLKAMAFNHYEKALTHVSAKEIFYDILGDVQRKRTNYIIAADYYRKAISFNPTKKEYYFKILSVLDEEIDTKEIIYHYKSLCNLEPENDSLLYNLGHTYLEDKNYFGAIETFKKAIKIQPNNPFYHNSLAYTLVQVDDYDGAINEYQKAININPDTNWTSIVCQALGAIYYQAKRNADAAIMSYQMALNMEPENPEALVSLAEIHYDKGNYDSAIACYTKALEFDKENAQANCNLGFVHWEKSEIDEAIKYYQQAIALHPEYDIAYNNLGVAYLDGKGQANLAEALFAQAIKHNPNYALAYYNRGRAYDSLGEKTKAADYYQMALDINTLTNEINPDEIKNKLSKLFKVD